MKVNYSDEDRKIAHQLIDKIIDEGEEVAFMSMCSLNEDFSLNRKLYRVLLKITDDQR